MELLKIGNLILMILLKKQIKTNTMKKYLFLLLILTSCGSRKTNTDKVKEVQKIETSETITDKSIIETNVKVIDCTDTQEQIIEPIDNTKEIVIDGKTYRNVRFKTLKKKNNISTTQKEVIQNNVIKKANTKAETKIDKKVKQTERKSSYWWLLWFLLIIPIYYLYRKYFGR